MSVSESASTSAASAARATNAVNANQPTTLPSATRTLSSELTTLLRGLVTGQRIRITQTVRINSRTSWPTVIEGAFREVNFLVTGLATDRVPEDDIIVATVHFTKDNGELSSITLNEKTQIQLASAS